MKAFKFTPLQAIFILFSLLATTTSALALAPAIPPYSAETVVLNQPFGPYQINTSTDGTPDAPVIYNEQGLPEGLILDPLTGIISGSPVESGLFFAELFATNSNNETGTGILEITVYDPAPDIPPSPVISVPAGESYTYTITASNSPTSFSVVGLSAMDTDAITPIDPSTGSFSFTPSVSGVGDTINLLIGAANSEGSDSEILQVNILPALAPTLLPATVVIDAPLGGSEFDPLVSTTIDISATVTPSAGETIDTVVVRWNNPPDKPSGVSRSPIILTSLDGPATGGVFAGTINIGFDPENRELPGGNFDLEVVAYQSSAADSDDFGSDTVNVAVKPLIDMLFPDDELRRDAFELGDIFASARVSMTNFAQVSARISGPGLVDLVVITSSNPNGIYNFNTTQAFPYTGTYNVRIEALDGLGLSTVIERQLIITESLVDPVAVVTSPNPGFTNEVFSAALLSYTQQESNPRTVNQVGVVGFDVTYTLNLLSPGQGYYPRNDTLAIPSTSSNNVTRSVPDVNIANGRVSQLPDEVTFFWSSDANGDGIYDDPEPRWGASGNAIMDDLSDPGFNGKIEISAQLFRANASLTNYKLFVNGEDVTPGVGNLDPNLGLIDAPIIDYPSVGSPDLGDYVVLAQAFDADGNVGNSLPISFQILPYEPLEITLSRSVPTNVAPDDPILVGGSATFLANVSPVAEIDFVEFFESNSGDKLGDGSKVTIGGNTVFRAGIVFEQAGDYKVFAKATGFNGQSVISAPVDISVVGGEPPEVEITSPLDGNTFTAGDTLTLTISASDDGAITTIDVFDGAELKGPALPTGAAGQYLFNLPTTSADLGVFNFIARATDDRGNVTDSGVVVVGLTQGSVPIITVLEPSSGENFRVDEPFIIRANVTDSDGIITSVVARQLGSSDSDAIILSATENPGEYIASPSYDSPVIRDLVITATDDDGNQTSTVPFQFTITRGVTPSVSIDSPLDAEGPFNLGEIISVVMTASDQDGFITQVELFNGAKSLGLASLTGNTYRFDYLATAPGLLDLRARATDDNGNTSISNQVSVSVITGAIPTVMIDSPADGGSIKLGETLKVTVTAADTAPGFITSVEVFDNDVSLGLASPTGNANEYSLSIPTSVADLGTLNLQARAVDNQGNVAYSAVIDHSVVQGAVPTVSIDSPLNADDFFINTPIPLAITAIPGDESIVSVEVFSNGTSAGFASSLGGNQYEFTLTETGEAGLQRLTAVATDELGNSTTSDEVNVILTSGISPVTVINTVNGVAPAVAPAVDVVDRGSIVTLEISASDSDGNVTQVEVFNGANSIGLASLVGVDTYRFDYQASSPGLLNLQVRSTDDLGNIGFSDLVPVSVITGDIPTATIMIPLASGLSTKSGEPLNVLVIAADTAPGFITSVEVFDNDVSLGLASPTGNANEYSLSIPTSVADLGTLNLQARAVDNQGNVAYSAVIDHSVVQGAVPTVSIDSPLNADDFFINTPIPLAITAIPGDESIVSVEVFSNGTSAGFASSLGGNQYEFTLTETGEAGLQRLTAVATDELGNSTTSDEVNVILTSGISPVTVINTVNGVAPAVAPAVDVVDRGSIVTLEISASDSDGNVTQVEVFNGANSIGLASLVGVDTYRFDYQASSPGLLNLQVRSTDDLGNIGFSDLATVSVITGDIPTATITSPSASGLSIKSGETLKVTVTAADTAPGFITSVEVFDNDVSLGLASPTGNANEYSLSIPTSVADLGTLNLQARAVDNQGNVAYSAVIDHSVVQGAVPTVSIDSPLNADDFFINTPIPLAITAIPGDESIVSVEVFSNGTSAGFASSLGGNQYEFTLTETGEAGLQRLTAVATDELGNSTTSDEVNVILTSGISPVTVINTVNGVAPAVAPAVDVVDRGSIVTLEISASDSDGNVTQVEVFNGANSIGLASLVGVDTYRFNYKASSPGLLNLQVRATDDLDNIGFSDLATVSVITGAIPTATITSPANGTSITSGKNIEILVTASDSDGNVTQVGVYRGTDLIGYARPTGTADEYLLSYTTSPNVLGFINLEAVVFDNQGNAGFSEIVPIDVVLGSVPQIEILSPQPGDQFFINQPFAIRARITDADGLAGALTATFTDNRVREERQLDNDGDERIVIIEDSRSFTGDEILGATATADVYEYVATLDSADLIGLVITAKDEDGNESVSREVRFTVTNGTAPDVAITAPVSEANYARGDVVAIEIDASDIDGSISEVKVLNGTTELGTASLVSNNKYRYNYTADTVGRVNLIAQATDDLGNLGISNIETITIVAGDIPTVTITSPAEATSYTAGDVITIDVDAGDTDGFVTSVDIFNGDVSLGTASKVSETEYRLNLSTSLTDLGDLQLNARATDNSGNVSISTFVEASVATGDVPTGLIVLPDGPYYEGDMLTIDVDVDDLDGYVTSVEIFNGDVSLGLASRVNDTKFRLVHGPLAPGNLQLRAVVTDDRGNASASNTVSTLVDANILPLLSIDSPVAMSAFDYLDVITFEITASDSDGFVTSVSVSHLDNGTPTDLGPALKVDSASDDQYRYSLDTALLTAGTKFISVSAVDNRGNSITEVVEIRLDVVPFSVNFVTQTATNTATNTATPLIASPYVIEGAIGEYSSALRRVTVEIVGIDASTLTSLDWQLQLDDGSAPESRSEIFSGAAEGNGQTSEENGQEGSAATSLTSFQDFAFSGTGILTVTATNTDGVSVQNSLTVFVDLPDPGAGDLTDFINYIYNQVQGSVLSAEELQDAIDAITALGGDTAANRAAFAATLFTSDQYNDSRYQTVALVYKTLTGQWPNQAQLETGLSTILQDTAAESNQTTVSLSGSITAGSTQVLNFNYSQGDQVTITVTGDGTNGNPLNDPTLTVSAPNGAFVGYVDDGLFGLNPSLSFIAPQTGAYSVTVGGFSSFLTGQGDFVAASISTAIESDTAILSARALVESLKGVYNGADGFLADAATGSSSAADFVAQIYLNKHELDIMTFNSAFLGGRLRGVDTVKSTGDIIPGYQSNVVNFVADFALDVDLTTGPYASFTTGDGYPYSKIIYYGRPNNPLSSWDQARAEIQSDANLNSALSALLGIQNPTASDLAPYAGMTLEEALAEIFISSEFAAQFVGDTAVLDTDLDGFSDIAEILLNTDRSAVASSPTSGQASIEVIGTATYFVLEFVRLKPSLTPSGWSVVLECADENFNFDDVSENDLESNLSLSVDQTGITDDYERVEYRVDTSSIDCDFFRLSVEPVESVESVQ